MDLLKVLANEPDKVITVTDDNTVELFLCDLGIADVFSEADELSDKPTVQLCGFDGHNTHLILACYFSGIPQKQENGYVLTCPPKNGLKGNPTSHDMVEGAERDQKAKGLRVIIRTPPRNN